MARPGEGHSDVTASTAQADTGLGQEVDEDDAESVLPTPPNTPYTGVPRPATAPRQLPPPPQASSGQYEDQEEDDMGQDGMDGQDEEGEEDEGSEYEDDQEEEEDGGQAAGGGDGAEAAAEPAAPEQALVALPALPPGAAYVPRHPTAFPLLAPVRRVADTLPGDSIAALLTLFALHVLLSLLTTLTVFGPVSWALLVSMADSESLARAWPYISPVLFGSIGAGVALYTQRPGQVGQPAAGAPSLHVRLTPPQPVGGAAIGPAGMRPMVVKGLPESEDGHGEDYPQETRAVAMDMTMGMTAGLVGLQLVAQAATHQTTKRRPL